MRVVGGIFRSRVLLSFSGNDIRPTSDKVRESIFNIIQSRIFGATFLDLFCGTGAMGIEALSRSAKKVHFNDRSKQSLELTKKNLKSLGVTDGVVTTNLDALTLLTTTREKYDIIFIDPPYASDLGVKSLSLVKNALNDDGIVIFEDEKKFDGQIEGLKVVDTRKYGRVHLTFFAKGE